MSGPKRLEVMITVDVEAWPRCPKWREEGMAGDLARDIYGATPDGDFGIAYQVDLLRRHGLKGVFFVEALMACEIGVEPLAKIVSVIQEAGSEVQLHIHTEWFEKMQVPLLGDTRAYNIRELTRSQQMLVIQTAMANLEKAGAPGVSAYRAGNFGADFITLEALAECGIRYDSSYNYSYLSTECGLDFGAMLVQPEPVQSLLEYPVSCFRDFPGHYRPAQLCAVSTREMQGALRAAREAQWSNFVIVSHSFEMLRDRKDPIPHAYPDWSVIDRFDGLCEFLSDHRSEYQAVGFHDLKPGPLSAAKAPLRPPVVSAGFRTAARVMSQAIRRLPRQPQDLVRRALLRRRGSS